MFIKSENAEKLLSETGKALTQPGIKNCTDFEAIDAFGAQLVDMSGRTKCKEGEQLDPENFALLQGTVRMVLENMAKGMVEVAKTDGVKKTANATNEKQNQGRFTYDPFPALVAVNDHLYAMAMKTLGCPDIPESFGGDITDLISRLAAEAELKTKENEYKRTDVDRVFKAQRKKDAAEVKKIIATNHNKIKDTKNKVSPLRLAQYAAEYHALKMRQERHTGIWRFFHSKQNTERMNLLEIMKKTINGALGNDEKIDIDKLSPIEIADAYNKKLIAEKAKLAFGEGALAARTHMPASAFKHAPTVSIDAAKDKEEPSIDLPEALKQDTALYSESTVASQDERVETAQVKEHGNDALESAPRTALH